MLQSMLKQTQILVMNLRLSYGIASQRHLSGKCASQPHGTGLIWRQTARPILAPDGSSYALRSQIIPCNTGMLRSVSLEELSSSRSKQRISVDVLGKEDGN